METGVVIIQEPVFTKTSIEEAPAGVLLDKSSMEVDTNHNTVLDDEITNRDCKNNIIKGKVDVVNGSGNKETEEPVRVKVEDTMTVKEKASETENDELGSILSDVTLEKEKEDDITRKQEEVSAKKPVLEEDQTETKHTPEQKDQIDTGLVKVEKSLNSAREETSIKIDDVKVEKDSITVETASEEETATTGEAVHDVETTKRVLLEAENDAEPKEKEETEIVKTVVEDPKIINHEETTGHESKSLKENAEPVEPEQISSEVTLDKEKDKEITRKTEEVQENTPVIDTPIIQGEDTEEHVMVRDIPQSETLATEAETVETSTVQESAILKSLETKTVEIDAEPSLNLKEDKEPTDPVQESITIVDPPKVQREDLESIISPELKEEANQSSKDTEEDENVLGRNKPPGEIIVTEAENLETIEDVKPVMDLKEDKDQRETDTIKSVNLSSDVQAEEFGKDTEPCSTEIKDESPREEEPVEVKTKENVQEESTEEKHEHLLDLPDNKPDAVLVAEAESRDKVEEIPSDLVIQEELKDDATKVDKVDGNQIMEEERGVDSNNPEAGQIVRNRTEEIPTLPNVESVEQIQKPSLESHSEVSEETSKIVDEKTEEKPEEEVLVHQEVQEKGSSKLETKEEPVSVLESRELGEKSQEERNFADLAPSKDESSLPNEQEKETKLLKEEVEIHELINEEVTIAQQTLVEPKDETVDGVETIADLKKNEDEQKADIIQRSLETVETTQPHCSLEKQEHGTFAEAEKVKEAELTGAEAEAVETLPVQETAFLKTLETKEDSDTIMDLKEDKEKETCFQKTMKTDENDAEPSLYMKDEKKPSDPVQESNTIIEPPKIQREEMESIISPEFKEEANQSSKDTEEDEHVLERNIVTEAENLETKEDEKPIMDLKEDKEQEETKTVISSDEKEEILEEKHEKNQDTKPETILVAEIESRDKDEEIPSDLVLKVDKEDLKDDDATNVDKVMEEQRSVESNDPEAEHINGNKTEEIPTLPDVEPVEKMQNPSLDSHSEVSEETSKTVDEKIEDKPNEQEKETQEVTNAQETLVEEKPDEVVQSSSVSASEEREDETVVGIEKIADMKANKDEQKADIVQRSLETVETTEPHSSFPSSLEKQEHGTVAEAEKIEDGEVKEAEPAGGTKEHEDVLVRDIPQVETLVTEAEAVETSTVQDSAILKTLETKDDDTEPIMDLKEAKEQELTETHLLDELSGESDKHQGNEPDTIKIEGKPEEVTQHQEGKEEGSYGLETKEKPFSEPESSELGVKSHEEESSFPNEQEKETHFQKEQIEKHEPPKEEVIQVPSASPSEEQEGEIAAEAEKIVNIKANEEKIKEDDVEESLSSTDEVNKEKESRPDEHDAAVPVEEISRDIGNETAPKHDHQGEKAEPVEATRNLDEVQETLKIIETPTIHGEDIDSKPSKLEHVLVRDIPQVETLVTEAKTVDTSTVQEAAILKTLETETDETEAVHNPIDGEVKGQDTKEDAEPSLDLKADKEKEETETVKTDISFDIKDESQGREESVDVKPKEMVQDESSQENDGNLLDVPSNESDEKMQKPSLESPSQVSKETSKTEDEKIEEIPKVEVKLHQEGREEGSNGLETKEDTISEQESTELEVKALEEESCPPNEQEKETKLQKEEAEKHEPTNEGIGNAQQTIAEEKSDEVVQVSEKREAETVVGVEKTEDIKANEDEQVEEKIERSIETVEIVEPHTSMPSPPEEHRTLAEATKTDDEKLKEIEPMGDVREKDPKSKQDKEIEEIKEVDEKKVDTIPQESLSDAIESHKELSNVEETKETTVAQEEQPRDIGASLTEKFSTDQTKPEEQVEGETKTKEPEDEYVDSSESFDPLIAETKKEDENIKVEEFENLEAPTKLEELKEDKSQENSETIKAIEATSETSEAYQTPSFVSELEDQIPKQIEEIHEEETKESHAVEATNDQILRVETTQADQTPSAELVSKHDDQTPKGVKEIQEEEAQKLQAEEILPTEITPRESSDEALVTKLASKEDEQVTPQEGSSTASENVCIKQEEFENPEAPKLEESKDISETIEPIEATNDQTLAIETSEANQTPSFVSELEDKIPNQVEEIHEEAHKEEAKSDQNLPVEASQEHETPSSESVSGIEDQNPKQAEEIHEEETKAQELQEEEILPTEIVPRESITEAPASMLASQEDDQVLKPGEIIEEQDSIVNEDFNFSKETGEAEQGDESSSTLPVVGILTQLQTTLENERAINDSASSEEKMITEPTEQVQKTSDVEPESSKNDLHSTKEENGLEEKFLPIEEVKQEEHKEEVKVTEEEIVEPEHVTSVEKQEKRSAVLDSNDSIAEKITLQEEHPRDFEISKTVGDDSDQVTMKSESLAEPPQTEQKVETHETVKEEDQIVDIKEEKKNEEVQDEKIRDIEDTSALDFVPRDVEKEEAPHSVLENEKEEINEVATSPSEAEKDSIDEHVEAQVISEDTKSNGTEQAIKVQREDVSADKPLTKEALGEQLQVPSYTVPKPSELIPSHNPLLEEKVQETSSEVKKAQEDKNEENVQDQPKNFEAPVIDKEPEDAIKQGVSIEEENNATKEIFQEESKQTDTVNAEIKEEQKETTQECLNSVKNNTDYTAEKTKPVTREIENLSSVSNTQDKSKQKDEVPTPKLEKVKTTEELQQKDKESENIFPEVKESEETVQEPARKSLSSLIEKVEGTNKNEDTTTKPHIKEEAKTEEEDENDKTSPDSIVMVEAKDTVSIIKTQHKKSPGILSGVGSKVKHSISKVKKVFTGYKSSHTTN